MKYDFVLLGLEPDYFSPGFLSNKVAETQKVSFLMLFKKGCMDSSGFEPEASALQGQRSTELSYEPKRYYS